ncbi:MAG: oligosaccharide flippase family protein [Clostridiales bacterium]|nr:oligosaccharide flippase family protein [Clostridiales bacterium]
MNEKRTIAKIGLIGVINQIIFAVLGFVSRKLFLIYIGVEILGLSSTYNSVLSTLALADLGFDIAVTYALYKPLHDNDETKINAIMRALKSIYNVIGIAFIVLSFVALPFLRLIITDMEFKPIYYLYFLMQAFASASTYFFAYRRTLLYADKKEYVTKTVDAVGNIIFSVLKIVLLVLTKSYIIYLACAVLQAFATNIYIYFKCYKVYPYLDSKSKTDKTLVKELIDSIKDIALGKISGYVYGCTDSLLISKLISTVTVGFYSNYFTVITIIKQLSVNIMGPVAPFIGNHLVENKDPEHQESVFQMYTYVRFLVAVVLLVPTIICIDTFIVIWLGEDYLMSSVIVLLICADLYISLVHSSLVDYANGAGLFRYEKYISFIGAVINLGASIILALKIGLPGILAGTVIAQIWYWSARSILVYRKCFKSMTKLGSYWLRMLYYLIVFIACVFACYYICGLINTDWLLLTFVLRGFACEIISVLIVGLVFIPVGEHRRVFKWAVSKIRR